ncbi:hypothetical protein HZC32_00150 [Candidatus Woesearchaeota archaeon]|nr:hypothetical protein [Candidatus Woesearchaeota archaeon]
MVYNNQRGQSAAGAAVLLAVIAGLLIMFIILIPPQQRAELLGEPSISESSGTSSGTLTNLLTVSPGKLDYLIEDEIEHPLPTVQLYTQTESIILAERNVAYIKRGLFSNQQNVLKFSLTDLKNTEMAFVSFKVEKVKGELIVLLNGEEVFNSKVEEKTSVPIILPKNTLQEENELVFSASSPGLAFWSTNEVSLKEIKVVAEVTDIESKFSRNIFLVSDTERGNLEKVILKFHPECKFGEVGKLVITINGKEIYNAIPDCGLSIVPIEFSPLFIHADENEIVFKAEKGAYVLSPVMIKSKLKELDFPVYYFQLSHEQYEQVKEEENKVRLRLEFVDPTERKKGEIIVNGHSEWFDTKGVSLEMVISEDMVQGNNAVKISPRNTMDIRELKVDLIK